MSTTAKQAYDRERYATKRAEKLATRPPDPITLLTETERAYIAGIIDGEGSIFVAAVGPNRRKTVYPIVTVAMTHRGVIDWLRDRLDCGTVKRHNHTARRRSPHFKEQFRVQVFGKRAQLLCSTLLPFLIVKREQARLVCDFPVDARIAPGTKIERTEINETRYRLRDQINALNH